MSDNPLKIVYITPAIYSAGGIERVVTMKTNYFAEKYGYDVTIIVTEGKGRDSIFPLSDKVKVINLEINFEELWTACCSKKNFLYIRKVRRYQESLTAELLHLHPNITVSTLRREINFLTEIEDGSVKIGELHLNRHNFRGIEDNCNNPFKRLLSIFWKRELVYHLKRLDKLIVLSKRSALEWPELNNVYVIPDPLPIEAKKVSNLQKKRVVTIGRYSYEKGYDLLLKAWAIVEKQSHDWQLCVYAVGNAEPYTNLVMDLGIDLNRCHLYSSIKDLESEYLNSSIFVLSSRYEGFGLVLVEAMASGLPVVSFDCPCGPQNLVTNGKEGLLIENGNVSALAQGIITLITEANRCKSLAEATSNSAQRFTMSRIASEWVKLFEDLR